MMQLDAWPPSLFAAERVLDSAIAPLRSADSSRVRPAMAQVCHALRTLRLDVDNAEWGNIRMRVMAHPIRALLHQDPFTLRAFAKPRGYPGDAALLDYIYGSAASASTTDVSDVGRAIADYTCNSPAPMAVRFRRDAIAGLIDEAADSFERPDILAVAAGHLCEADRSRAVAGGRLGRFVAVDQDPESVAETTRRYRASGITAVCGTVRQLIGGRGAFKGFHLVYAAGLFDYLTPAIGARCAERMFEATAAGGSMVIVNFLPGVPDVGYMETFMDWQLIFRTEAEMLALVAGLPSSQRREVTLWRDPEQHLVFLRVRRI